MSAYLVRKPRRKRHLAGAAAAGVYWTVCDRVVDGPRLEAIAVEDVDVDELEQHADDLCVECRRMILFADVVATLGVGRLVASLDLTA